MEVREAGLGDLPGIVEVHSRARVAYYGAGGLPVGEVLTPELAREQREGWAAAITSAWGVRCTRCSWGTLRAKGWPWAYWRCGSATPGPARSTRATVGAPTAPPAPPLPALLTKEFGCVEGLPDDTNSLITEPVG